MQRAHRKAMGVVGGAVLAVGAALAMPSFSHATPITVANHSFEVDATPDDGSFNVVTSWTVGGAGGYFDPKDYAFAGTTGDNVQGVLPDGCQVGIITNYYNGTLGGSLTQTGLGNVTANATYTLTVAVGTRLDITSGGWMIELLAGGTTIASNSANSGPASGTFVDYQAVSSLALVNANIGQPLSIKISGFNPTGNTATAQVAFDNVRLDAAVPEPASIGLLGLGGLLALRGRA